MVFTTKIKKVGGSYVITIPPNEMEFNDYKLEEWLQVRIMRTQPGVSGK